MKCDGVGLEGTKTCPLELGSQLATWVGLGQCRRCLLGHSKTATMPSAQKLELTISLPLKQQQRPRYGTRPSRSLAGAGRCVPPDVRGINSDSLAHFTWSKAMFSKLKLVGAIYHAVVAKEYAYANVRLTMTCDYN